MDGELWVESVIEESEPPPPFYCEAFREWADAAYEHMGLTQANVTPNNCRAMYIKLIQYMDFCHL